jgi:hypothetical protein
VVEFDGRLVAVGCRDESCIFGPAMWVSDASGAFVPATVEPSIELGAAQDVVATADGLVAVGNYPYHGDDLGRAAVWISADGRQWREVPPIDGGDHDVMHEVARAGDTLIAVGSASDDMESLRPGAWQSTDGGETWQSIGVDAFSDDRALFDGVVYTGTSIVAVGWSQAQEPFEAFAFVSADGVEWTRVPLPMSGVVRAIADGPGGLIAVGGMAQSGLQVWRSVDRPT